MYLVTVETYPEGYGTCINVLGLFDTMEDAEKAVEINREKYFSIMKEYFEKDTSCRTDPEERYNDFVDWLVEDEDNDIFKISEIKPNRTYSYEISPNGYEIGNGIVINEEPEICLGSYAE